MAKPRYDALADHLREQYGDDLRWVATFDSDRFTYRVRAIRKDLETELSEHQLDTIVHRSMALFDRDRMDDVYFHLGEVEAMLVQHEVAMAVHLYLDGSTGVVVKVERDAEVTMPTQVDEWLGVLGVN
ncbi:MAG: hypothetical protein V5A61_13420 [Haloarculaceae archaeon]